MDDDDALFAELADVLRPQLVPPPEVTERAKRLFTWRTVDAEIATLTNDSVIDVSAGPTRAAEGPRVLTFQLDALIIELEIDDVGRRVIGQLEPAEEVGLAVHADDVGRDTEVTATGRSDAIGRFILPLPMGERLVSLRCQFPDGTVIRTARIRI